MHALDDFFARHWRSRAIGTESPFFDTFWGSTGGGGQRLQTGIFHRTATVITFPRCHSLGRPAVDGKALRRGRKEDRTFLGCTVGDRQSYRWIPRVWFRISVQ